MRNDESSRATLIGAACLLLFGLPPVYADPATAPHPAPTAPTVLSAAPVDNSPSGREGASAAEEMTHLQEDTVLLKAQLKRLDAQTEVAEKSAALNRLGDNGGLEQIQVVAIEGLGHKMQATLQFPDGGQFDVGPGDTLPNGIRIASIEAKSVTVERHGEKPARLLLVALQAGAARNTAQPYSAYQMPFSSLPFPKD